jgi:diguanylate cyclase (GGDEF)-like protein
VELNKHPSGVAEPSGADELITDQLKDALSFIGAIPQKIAPMIARMIAAGTAGSLRRPRKANLVISFTVLLPLVRVFEGEWLGRGYPSDASRAIRAPGSHMPPAGHTTVIQRLLERRTHETSNAAEGTTATIAVMVRVIPPPKALLSFSEVAVGEHIKRNITPDMLDIEELQDEHEVVRRLKESFWPVIVTDSLELIRKVRAGSGPRAPFVVYVSELDESSEREAGLVAGADECLGRRTSDREVRARLMVGRRVAELESALRVTLEENRKLSATDELTRTASRRFFGKHFPREVERAARYDRGLSLILCDIDHFKQINDTLGHPAGDQILRQFGRRLQQLLRAGVDWVARIGGEEFAIVMPETNYESALEVARKVRGGIAQTSFKVDNKPVPVTASFGLCGLDRVVAGERRLAERMLKVADQALYRSKSAGRNRVTATNLKPQADRALPPRMEPVRSEAETLRESTRVIRRIRS